MRSTDAHEIGEKKNRASHIRQTSPWTDAATLAGVNLSDNRPLIKLPITIPKPESTIKKVIELMGNPET